MTRVLVSGGTGFIGSHLVRDCLARGDEVTVLAREESDFWRLADVMDQLGVLRADPLDSDATAAVLASARPERIFLLAAATRFQGGDGLRDMDLALRMNVEPLRVMLDAIAGMKDPPHAVIRTGTLAEIAGDDPAQDGPASIYGLSILMGTHLQRIWRDWTAIPAVTARLSLTYGGDQSADFFIPAMIDAGFADALTPPRNPDAERDLLHVDDVVAALQLIADNAAELPAAVNVSTGAPHRLDDLAQIIAQAFGQVLPAADAAGGGDVVSAVPSPALLALGWAPQIGLKEGIASVIEWERDRAATTGGAMKRRPA